MSNTAAARSYASAGEWLKEPEGFSIRLERLAEDVALKDVESVIQWVKTAWALGAARGQATVVGAVSLDELVAAMLAIEEMEDQHEWFVRWRSSIDEWKEDHSGDCMRNPQSCLRCQYDEAILRLPGFLKVIEDLIRADRAEQVITPLTFREEDNDGVLTSRNTGIVYRIIPQKDGGYFATNVPDDQAYHEDATVLIGRTNSAHRAYVSQFLSVKLD